MESVEKLRECVESDCAYCGRQKDLLDIADRIDAEYGKVLHEAIRNALANGKKSGLRQIADTHMPLPVDADGVPIRIGDEMTNRQHAGKFVVEAIGGGPKMHVVYFRSKNGLGFHYANQCHHHSPTVEDKECRLIVVGKAIVCDNCGAEHNGTRNHYTDGSIEVLRAPNDNYCRVCGRRISNDVDKSWPALMRRADA